MKSGKMHGYLDNLLVRELDFVKKLPANDFDCFGIGTGSEGSGKTTLFMSICGYLDPGFNIDRIVFTPEQFEDAVSDAPSGSAILFDEADVMSDNVLNQRLRILSKVMKRIRSKQLFIFFVTPTFFDMGKYFAIHRSRFLIHVYTKGMRRGAFRFYNNDSKRLLYINGKKFWNMDCVKSTFYGGFGKLPKGFPIDLVAYNAKKDAATMSLFEDAKSGKQVLVDFRQACVDRVDRLFFQKTGDHLSQSEIAFVFGVDQSTISKDLKAIGGRG